MGILILLLNLVVGFFLLKSIYNSKLNFGGQIWNIRVPMSTKQQAFMTRNKITMVICWVAFIILVVPVFKVLLGFVFSGSLRRFFLRLLLSFLYVALFVGCAFLGGYLAYVKAPKSPLLTKENNAAILADLPFIQQIETQIDQAHCFYIGFNGIALYNDMDYCYAVVRYEDFQMGNLNSANEVALMGLYFVQKYHQKYSFVIDSVYIPGEPGQRVSVVGSSGYHVAYTSGTSGETIFRGYIFTRIPGK